MNGRDGGRAARRAEAPERIRRPRARQTDCSPSRRCHPIDLPALRRPAHANGIVSAGRREERERGRPSLDAARLAWASFRAVQVQGVGRPLLAGELAEELGSWRWRHVNHRQTERLAGGRASELTDGRPSGAPSAPDWSRAENQVLRLSQACWPPAGLGWLPRAGWPGFSSSSSSGLNSSSECKPGSSGSSLAGGGGGGKTDAGRACGRGRSSSAGAPHSRGCRWTQRSRPSSQGDNNWD